MILVRVGEEQAARELAETSWPAAAGSWARITPTPWPPPSSLVGALFGLAEYHAARGLNDDIIARRRRVLGDEHPETMMARRLRPHPARARPRWRVPLDGRAQGKRQEAPARGPGAERRRAWMKDRPATGLTGCARDDLGDGEHDLWLTAPAAANRLTAATGHSA